MISLSFFKVQGIRCAKKQLRYQSIVSKKFQDLGLLIFLQWQRMYSWQNGKRQKISLWDKKKVFWILNLYFTMFVFFCNSVCALTVTRHHELLICLMILRSYNTKVLTASKRKSRAAAAAKVYFSDSPESACSFFKFVFFKGL